MYHIDFGRRYFIAFLFLGLLLSFKFFISFVIIVRLFLSFIFTFATTVGGYYLSIVKVYEYERMKGHPDDINNNNYDLNNNNNNNNNDNININNNDNNDFRPSSILNNRDRDNSGNNSGNAGNNGPRNNRGGNNANAATNNTFSRRNTGLLNMSPISDNTNINNNNQNQNTRQSLPINTQNSNRSTSPIGRPGKPTNPNKPMSRNNSRPYQNLKKGMIPTGLIQIENNQDIFKVNDRVSNNFNEPVQDDSQVLNNLSGIEYYNNINKSNDSSSLYKSNQDNSLSPTKNNMEDKLFNLNLDNLQGNQSPINKPITSNNAQPVKKNTRDFRRGLGSLNRVSVNNNTAIVTNSNLNTNVNVNANTTSPQAMGLRRASKINELVEEPVNINEQISEILESPGKRSNKDIDSQSSNNSGINSSGLNLKPIQLENESSTSKPGQGQGIKPIIQQNQPIVQQSQPNENWKNETNTNISSSHRKKFAFNRKGSLSNAPKPDSESNKNVNVVSSNQNVSSIPINQSPNNLVKKDSIKDISSLNKDSVKSGQSVEVVFDESSGQNKKLEKSPENTEKTGSGTPSRSSYYKRNKELNNQTPNKPGVPNIPKPEKKD